MLLCDKVVLVGAPPGRYVSSMTQRKSRNRRELAVAVQSALMAAPNAPHRIADVAAELGVSPFHLARVFRAETGTTVHQYLLRIRMKQALSRLHAGEPHLSRLALDLGFSSHSHFTETFRRHFGESPARLRAAGAVSVAHRDNGRVQW